MARITLLHTNDLHGKLSAEKLPFLLEARARHDFYFDTGDAIKAGNLALPLKADPAWAALKEARCTASVPGNRESHPLVSGKKAKFNGAGHPVLCANWKDKRGRPVFPAHAVLEHAGLKIGVFGVMVPMVTARMATQATSQYLWDPPIDAALEACAALREECDLLIALTHVGLTQDRRLAEATGDIDLILGGHSHNVLETPETVSGTPICQGGSHARFLGSYTLDTKSGLVKAELVPWP